MKYQQILNYANIGDIYKHSSLFLRCQNKKSFSTLTKDESSNENINNLSEDKSEPILVPGANRIKRFMAFTRHLNKLECFVIDKFTGLIILTCENTLAYLSSKTKKEFNMFFSMP